MLAIYFDAQFSWKASFSKLYNIQNKDNLISYGTDDVKTTFI